MPCARLHEVQPWCAAAPCGIKKCNPCCVQGFGVNRMRRHDETTGRSAGFGLSQREEQRQKTRNESISNPPNRPHCCFTSFPHFAVYMMQRRATAALLRDSLNHHHKRGRKKLIAMKSAGSELDLGLLLGLFFFLLLLLFPFLSPGPVGAAWVHLCTASKGGFE